MNKYGVVLIASLALYGCGEGRKYKIVCDSGFDTGPHDITSMREGIVLWRDHGENANHRKMLEGEICKRVDL